MERERDKQLAQLGKDADKDWKDEVSFRHESRLSDLNELFKRANDAGKKREVPDYLMSKVSS